MITYEEPNKVIDIEVDDVRQDIISDIPMNAVLSNLRKRLRSFLRLLLKYQEYSERRILLQYR